VTVWPSRCSRDHSSKPTHRSEAGRRGGTGMSDLGRACGNTLLDPWQSAHRRVN